MASTSKLAALIARRIREVRAEKGWTQVRLATEAGVARTSIATIEAGHDVPSLEMIGAVSRALGVPPAGLLLDPSRTHRDAVAVAVLGAAPTIVARAAEVVGVAAPKTRR